MPAGASQGLPIPLMPGMAPSTSASMMSSAFAQSLSMVQRGGPSSASSSFPDPYTEPAAYKEWYNSLLLSQLNQYPLPQPDGNPPWAAALGRIISKHSSTDTSMPDYISSASGHSFLAEQIQVHNTGTEDAVGTQPLKVPTNTPTAAAKSDDNGQSSCESLANGYHSILPDQTADSLIQLQRWILV